MKGKHIKYYFKCEGKDCHTETDKGREIDGKKLCMACFNKYQKEQSHG